MICTRSQICWPPIFFPLSPSIHVGPYLTTQFFSQCFSSAHPPPSRRPCPTWRPGDPGPEAARLSLVWEAARRALAPRASPVRVRLLGTSMRAGASFPTSSHQCACLLPSGLARSVSRSHLLLGCGPSLPPPVVDACGPAGGRCTPSPPTKASFSMTPSEQRG
jgi:hypothetical protein